MSNGILLAVDDPNVANDLRSIIGEMNDADVRGMARSTVEMRDLIVRLRPQVVMVSNTLGPEPVRELLQDLTIRRPEVAFIEVGSDGSAGTVIKALEAGARGVVSVPLAFEDVAAKLNAAMEHAERISRVASGSQQRRRRRGRVVTVAGAKGGVGTTTLATHMAIDQARSHEEQLVCLVDVDVEKGDVPALIDVRQSVSIADVAKISSDLNARAVRDAIVEHENGVHLLLAPVDVREAEHVTAEALRSIFEVLRMDYDVVFVDAGGHVSPSQAALVELADEVLTVVEADAMTMRAFRRRVLAWEALGVRKEHGLRIVVNKHDRAALFPVTATGRLTVGQVIEEPIPYLPRVVEQATNSRDPLNIKDSGWWRHITRLRQELGLEAPPQGRPPRTQRRRRGASEEDAAADQVEPKSAPQPRTMAGDRGAIALENAGIIPIALMLIVICWQVGVTGLTFFWNAQAATAASHEYAISHNSGLANLKARQAVPNLWSRGTLVSSGVSDVTVVTPIPTGLGHVAGLPNNITTTRSVVIE